MEIDVFDRSWSSSWIVRWLSGDSDVVKVRESNRVGYAEWDIPRLKP